MERIGNNGEVRIENFRNNLKPSVTNEETQPCDRIELSKDKCKKVENDPVLLKEVLEKLPGIDIHRHLEGAIKPKTALKLAEKYGIELPAKTEEELSPYMCVTEQDKTLSDFLKKFSTIGKLFINTDAIREISTQCVLDAKEENMRAMELRFSPNSMISGKNMSLKQAVDAVIEGVREGEKQTGITVSLTMIIQRHKGVDLAKDIKELAKSYVDDKKIKFEEGKDDEKPVQGYGRISSIDLACDEAQFPADPYAPIFLESEQDGLHRTMHAGEARGSDSVRTALEKCHAERIGHGVRSFEDPALVEELVKKEVVLEMCPTSNIQTGAVDSLKNHPLKKFYDLGGKPTINTDDPGVCGTDLKSEYMKSISDIGCTLEDVENMILFAVDGIFLPPPVKAALRSSIMAEIKSINEKI